MATAWWLSQRYIPFAQELWLRTGSEFDAHSLVMAKRIAGEFIRFAKRHLKGDDQGRDAARTLTRGDAAWLAAMSLCEHEEGFPDVVPRTIYSPSPGQLSVLPLEEARTFVFGLGTYETMRRCHERVYSQKPGPERRSLTLAGVGNKQAGNPVNGGDERYERRLRKRAKEDEVAAAIAEEWEQAMRALEARSKR